MNLNLVKKNALAPFTDEEISSTAKEMKLHPKLVEVLFSRGIVTKEEIQAFLYPNKSNFHNPLLLKGMEKATKRINEAIKNKETIAVFGDYDADGICASAILYLYLKSCECNVFAHIPSRSGSGYGLNIESIESIIEERNPDLILTCDCGISSYKEVEHTQDLGVDIIVTDHHEIAEILPDCVVINPKQTDCDYPINYLCGAGVALKLVQSLGGLDCAMQYIDLACVATIADLVPLTDENRLIVQFGLEKINRQPQHGIEALMRNIGLKNVTSNDIAFKIAPRINAAGRMGDAYRAFELLVNDDYDTVEELIKDIELDNTKRKTVCDELYNEATGDLQYEDMVNTRSIVLSHPSWEKGITGIAAARLTNDYRRPSIILVKSGDLYKGTSRSIDGINLYELLTYASEYLVEYGGHSGAAGFSIKEENIPLFKTKINEYLAKFEDCYFKPKMQYDLELDSKDLNFAFVSEMEKLEPVGNSNPKPLFKISEKNLKVTHCKNNFNHLNIVTESGTQLLAFNFLSYKNLLIGDADKELVVEVSLSEFNGKLTSRSVLKGVEGDELYIDKDQVDCLNMLSTLYNGKKSASVTKFSAFSEVQPDNIFGTLFIAYSEQTYHNFLSQVDNSKIVLHELCFSSSVNNYTRIILSPKFDANLPLENYSKIVFLDAPIGDNVLSYIAEQTKAKIFVTNVDKSAQYFDGITTKKEVFVKYFTLIKRENGNYPTIVDYFKKLFLTDNTIDIRQFALCYMVFYQLGIFTVNTNNGFNIRINNDVKTDLTNSPIYMHYKNLFNE